MVLESWNLSQLRWIDGELVDGSCCKRWKDVDCRWRVPLVVL